MVTSQPQAGLSWMMQAIKGLWRTQPRTQWAEVTAVSPRLLIVLEHDESQTARPVSANAAGPLVVGQRVLCLWEQRRLTVIGAGRAPGITGPGGWATPLLTGGWQNYGRGYFRAAWRRTPYGIQLRGLIRYGTVDQPAFRVPGPIGGGALLSGVTYTNRQIVPCCISVNASGSVTPSTGANPDTWVSLDGITIPT